MKDLRMYLDTTITRITTTIIKNEDQNKIIKEAPQKSHVNIPLSFSSITEAIPPRSVH